MTTLSIATSHDIPALCDLLTLLFAQEIEFQPDPQAQQRGLAAIIAHAEVGHVLVAKAATGQALGMVSLLYTVSTALGGKVALLEDMVMHPHYRHQGIGSALLQYAIDLARQQQVLRITLLTDADNTAAQRFYRKHGFQASSMQPWRYMLATTPTA